MTKRVHAFAKKTSNQAKKQDYKARSGGAGSLDAQNAAIERALAAGAQKRDLETQAVAEQHRREEPARRKREAEEREIEMHYDHIWGRGLGGPTR